MKINFQSGEKRFVADLNDAISIAIQLKFNGDQPSHFGAPAAESKPMEVSGFVGSIARGGSCNVNVLKLNPHCNGTHTESVGHIVDHPVPVATVINDLFCTAALISVGAKPAAETNESYGAAFDPDDLVIESDQILKNEALGFNDRLEALVVRTLPNSEKKLSYKYGDDQVPAFFTREAMEAIIQLGIRHLIVDLPSIDKMYDGGMLANHHLFWSVDQELKIVSESNAKKTVTEMVYVPDSVEDGLFLLNLQIPAFENDAAPSQPVLIPAIEIAND